MSDISAINTSLYKILTTGSIIKLANRLLLIMNEDITNHNERTAYIALKIAESHPMRKRCSTRNLVFLSLFHTIGFYREDFTFSDTSSEPLTYFSQSKAVNSKYIFGCYYLEYMTPLEKDARALETFNQPFDKDLNRFIYHEEYKSILYLSARISDYLHKNPDKNLPEDLNELAPGYFDPEYVEAFKKINRNNEIVNAIRNKSYKSELFSYITKIDYPIEDHIKMMKLLIYLLDFKSTFTMKHSINTSCYAISLGIRMGLTGKDLIDLFLSAFLHDVGKIAIPAKILESPNKLTENERKIMQTHVLYSKQILHGIIDDQIVENVYRHHEKLNGCGYPQHLTGEKLTETQRILTVADITSALNDSRSYKEEYSKDRTCLIIDEMTKEGELDSQVTDFVINDFDNIQVELRYLQELLSTDFSVVIRKYNDYLFNDTDEYTTSIISHVQVEDNNEDEEPEEMEEIEELQEVI